MGAPIGNFSSRNRAPRPSSAVSTWPAISTVPRGDPGVAEPIHQPSFSGFSGTSSARSGPTPTAWTAASMPSATIDTRVGADQAGSSTALLAALAVPAVLVFVGAALGTG